MPRQKKQKVKVNPDEIAEGFTTWLAMYLLFKANEKNVAHNGLVVDEKGKVWVYTQGYLAEKAIAEIISKLPAKKDVELLRTHFYLQNLNGDGERIAKVMTSLPIIDAGEVSV